MGLLRSPRVLTASAYVPSRKGSTSMRSSLVSSAELVLPENIQKMKRVHETWQDEALAFYDRCGEAREAANFYARAFSDVRIFPARRDQNGQITETDDSQVVDLFKRVTDRSGGQTEILSSYGRMMFITGDGYLVATGTGESEEPEVWEFIAPQELRLNGDQLVRLGASPTDGKEVRLAANNLDAILGRDQIRPWRFWRRHPANSWRADAPMHSVLDLFEELVLLTAAVRARVKSRLASAGILLIPEEITFAEEDSEASGGEDPDQDVFLKRLIDHMTQPILQEGTASAVVPFILKAAAEYLAAIRHIKLHDPNETYRETGLRMETLKRIAIGIDMPPEVLLGLSDSNHWTAWQVDEQVVKAHINPLGRMFCDDLASAYLRPAAKQAGIEWRDLTVGFDASQLVIHPDKSQNAKDLHDRIVIGDAALRKATGFRETDAPTQDEVDRQLAIKLRDAQLLAEQPSNVTDADDRTSTDVDQEAPATQPQFSDRATRLAGAAWFSVIRARNMAGARAVRKAQNCDECKALIAGVPKHKVSAALGASRLFELGVRQAHDLVDGTAHEFAAAAIGLGVSEAAALRLGEQVENHAARTLFDEEPEMLPPAFDKYVEKLAA